MKILKGTKVKVKHSRKGNFYGIAKEDFDTEEEWYPIILDQEYVEGASIDWVKGEEIPCRNGLCIIEIKGIDK